MKYRILILAFIAVATLMPASCSKSDPFLTHRPPIEYVSGDDKDKIDLKGSLLKPDMRFENIYAEITGETIYIYFNEPMEPCLVTLTAENNDLLYARKVQKQHPATLRIFLGSEPTGNYRLYISNGTEEASAWFHFENKEAPNRCPVPIEIDSTSIIQ